MKNSYEIRGDVTVIFINYKNETVELVIDTNDFDKVSSIRGRWIAFKHHSGNIYVRHEVMINGKRKRIFIHRYLMEPKENLVVDHINHNTLDNRRCNLRIVTNAENKQNLISARSDSKSGVRGVKYSKKDRLWYAGLKLNGKYIHLGGYDTKELAARVVKEGRKKYMPYSQEALAD